MKLSLSCNVAELRWEGQLPGMDDLGMKKPAGLLSRGSDSTDTNLGRKQEKAGGQDGIHFKT